MLVGLIGWYVTYASIRNLKGMVPFANHHLYDGDLARLDKAMFGGHRPATLLHDLLGTGASAHILSFFYIAWIALLPASLAIALVWARRDRISSWWVTAVSLDWIMGVILNYALPTLGPIYDRPGDFADLTTTSTTTLQQSMWTERLEVLADPSGTHTVQNIAAFASLHVAIAATACIVAHRAGLHRAIVHALRAFLVITMISTVYFGWHYVSDVIAGPPDGHRRGVDCRAVRGPRGARQRRCRGPDTAFSLAVSRFGCQTRQFVTSVTQYTGDVAINVILRPKYGSLES